MTRRTNGSGPAAGLTIRYAFAPSSLGLVLAGATDVGLCCVMLADDESTARAALREEFPAADLLLDETAVGERAARIAACVDGIDEMPHLPLDLQGTEFQRSVWEALLRIPSGTTATYTDVAQRDMILATRMTDGMEASYQRLERELVDA